MSSKDSVSLKLDGKVPIELYRRAIDHLDDLIRDLSDEVAGPDVVQWEVSKLEGGSAFAELTGYSPVTQEVEKVVNAYRNVSYAVMAGEEIPYYSPLISQSAFSIVSLINGDISSVTFGAGEKTVTISERIDFEEQEHEADQWSLGVITGVAGTIWDRPQVRIAVYDDLFEKVVYCYLGERYEEQAPKIWRKRVSVTGLIYRDIETGQPKKVKGVSSIEVLDDHLPNGFLSARGVIPWQEGNEHSEVVIRRLRDGF